MSDTDTKIRVRINGFDVEGGVPDIRGILGLDVSGMTVVPEPPAEPETPEPPAAPAKAETTTTKKSGTRTQKAKETAGDKGTAKASDSDSLDVDMDEVIDWLIAEGKRNSKVGRKPNADAIKEYLEAHGKKAA